MSRKHHQRSVMCVGAVVAAFIGLVATGQAADGARAGGPAGGSDRASAAAGSDLVAIGPVLRVSNAFAREGDGPGPRFLSFTVGISHATTGPVSVTLETREGTARAATDFVARRATITIPTGGTSARFVVFLRNDDLQEYAPATGSLIPEDFSLQEVMTARVVTAVGAAILDGTGVGRIEEDDRAFDSFVASANGHSWSNAYLLAMAAHYAYREELGATTEAEYRLRFSERFGKLGLETVAHVSGSSAVVDLQAVVMRNQAALVIVFRGTKELTDIVTDAVLVQLPVFLLASVHLGFWTSVETAYTELRNLARAAGTRRIWITGHSLGGALANVLAYRLAQDGITVKGVYTYGAPRVGNTSFAVMYNALFADRPTQRWVNANDPVPLLLPPVLGWAHPGQYNHIVQRPFTSVFDANLNVLVEAPAIADVTMGDHNGRRYLNRILSNAPAGVRSRMPPPPTTN